MVFIGTFLVTAYSLAYDTKLSREYIQYIKSFYTNESSQKVLKRPIIHTYYAKKLEHVGEAWDTEEHLDMLELWKEQWVGAGWEPRVLHEDHAKQHPYYDTFQKELEKLKVSSYNYFCFHRWLAMVVVGGGWMSDYDVVPLNIDQLLSEDYKDLDILLYGETGRLPHNGEFTSFCSTVPCLMSGSAAEWDRMISQLMTYVPQYEHEHFSDMFAMFRYFRTNTDSFHMHNKVATHLRLLSADDNNNNDGNGEPSIIIDCDAYSHQLAWHFSHHSYNSGIETKGIIVSPDQEIKSRAWFMRMFLTKWQEQCKHPPRTNLIRKSKLSF